MAAYDPITDTKFCPLCQTRKPGSEFTKRKNHGSDPYSGYCKDCDRRKCANWAKNNKEKRYSYMHNYHIEHVDYQREYDAQRWATPEIRERIVKQRTANPDKLNSYSQARRAKVNNAAGRFTADDIKKIKELQINCCAACKKKLKKYHIDHVIPLFKGGTNHPENLQLLCPRCNLRKSTLDPLDFMRRLGFLL